MSQKACFPIHTVIYRIKMCDMNWYEFKICILWRLQTFLMTEIYVYFRKSRTIETKISHNNFLWSLPLNKNGSLTVYTE